MEKKFFLFVFLLLTGLVVRAQSGWLATTTRPGGIENTIIREYQEVYSVSYVRTANGCYFAWSDNQTMIQFVEIDSKYIVYDFEIYEDTVCFCGEYSTMERSYGLVGWFSIPDLFGGTDNYHIYDYFQTRILLDSSPTYYISSVSVFKDLSIFKNEECSDRMEHIALVGKSLLGEPCVAELKGFFRVGNWTYTTATAVKRDETLDQVVETDNYIVTAGTSYDWNSIILSFFYKTAMYTTAPMLGDILHGYTSSALHYPMSNFKMTALNGDTIATLSFFYDNSYPNSDGMVMHIIDAADAISDPLGLPCVDNRMIYNTTIPYTVNRLTYSNTRSTLAGLVRSDNPLTGNTSLMGEMTCPLASSVDYFSKDDYYFFDHDNYFLGTVYIAMGMSDMDNCTMAIYARHLGTVNTSPCGFGGAFSTVRRDFGLRNQDRPLTTYSKPFNFTDIEPLGYEEHSLVQICIEP